MMLITVLRNGFVNSANKTRWQLFRYFFAGGMAAIIDWGIYWLLISAFAFNYYLAATFSFVLAITANYVFSAYWVFKNKRRHSRIKEILLVFLISSFGLLITQVCLVFFIEFLTLHYMIAKVIATGIVFFWNFFLRKHVVFG